MWVIEDTRQQNNKHTMKHDWFNQNDVHIIRCKLPFGDYALPPAIAIDTKKGLDEIAGNICGGHEEHQRFKRECIAARDAGCRLYFLVENDLGISSIDQVHTWKNPRSEYYADCVQGPRLEKAMKTMAERYGCVFLFCDYSETAQIIKDILEGVNEHGE